MAVPPQPQLTKVDVWICRRCWDDQDDINHGPDATPRTGWTKITTPDRRCYCCGSPLLEACAVIRYLDLHELDIRAKVW